MTENEVNPPINNDPMEKRNEFIDHPLYLSFNEVCIHCADQVVEANEKSGDLRRSTWGCEIHICTLY